MSSLPGSYQFSGSLDDDHVSIPSPSSILLFNNPHLLPQHHHHVNHHHSPSTPSYHNHRSITMNMLQHQHLIECFATNENNQLGTESVSSSCSSPSSLLPTSGVLQDDDQPILTNSVGSNSVDNSHHYLHLKNSHHHDSFDSNVTNQTLEGDHSRDQSRNNSFSSSMMLMMDQEPIFILSPTTTTSGENSLSSSLDNNTMMFSSNTITDNTNNNNNYGAKGNNLLMIHTTTTNNNNTDDTNHHQTIRSSPREIRSSPRDIKPTASTKVAYSLNDNKSTQAKGQIEEGISELEQLFASRRAFNSLSNKYSTDNLLKEQKKRSKHSAKEHLLLSQQPISSVTSFSASSTSTSFLEPSSRALRSTKSSSCLSPNTPISDSFEEIKSIIQAYYNYESFVESVDGREELRLYLRKRHNEEMLLMLETRITFLSFYEEGSNFYVGKRALLKVKEFQMIYSQFIDTNSQFCINIDSSIRKKFVKLNPRVNLVNTEQEASLLVKEIDECLDTLHFSVSLQVKTEIFSQFKKTEEFQTFILSKIIELQGKKAWEELERQNSTSQHDSPSNNHGGFFSFLKKNPQNSAIKKFEEKSVDEFLIENELSEYCGQFKKKKLYALSQIQNYTCDDYLKLGVIKVTHQTRLIRLVGQYFKSYCNKN